MYRARVPPPPPVCDKSRHGVRGVRRAREINFFSFKGTRSMKTTILRLAETISDAASELGVNVEALTIDDPGIGAAEAVMHLRDAQRSLNQAKDSLTLAIARQNDDDRTTNDETTGLFSKYPIFQQ